MEKYKTQKKIIFRSLSKSGLRYKKTFSVVLFVQLYQLLSLIHFSGYCSSFEFARDYIDARLLFHKIKLFNHISICHIHKIGLSLVTVIWFTDKACDERNIHHGSWRPHGVYRKTLAFALNRLANYKDGN